MSRAIGLLKYEKLTRLGAWIATRLEKNVRAEPELFAADVAVPVPLHPARQRERGYNQAELIARPLARKLKLPLGAYFVGKDKTAPAATAALAARALAEGPWRLRNSKRHAS